MLYIQRFLNIFKSLFLKTSIKIIFCTKVPYFLKVETIKNCDFVIAVTAPLETCISRVIKRDGVTRAHVLSRINNQWLSFKKSIQSHYIIENTTLEETQKKVHNIHNILTKKNL